MTRTITGTSHFVSHAAAVRYYSDYHYDDVEAAVVEKLATGEIHIGPPKRENSHQFIEIINNGTRYAIVEG